MNQLDGGQRSGQNPDWNYRPNEYGLLGAKFGTTCLIALIVDIIVAAILQLCGVSFPGVHNAFGSFLVWSVIFAGGELVLAGICYMAMAMSIS